MENITTKKRLSDYKDTFNDFFDGKIIKRIAEKTRLSTRTVYNYMSGEIPETSAGEFYESEILKESLIVIEELKLKINSVK